MAQMREARSKDPVGPLTADQKIHLALEELRRRGVNDDYCPRCGVNDWNIDLLDTR
jgi:hypothetical protein